MGEPMIVASSAREAIAEAYERGRQAGKTEADAALRQQAGRLAAMLAECEPHLTDFQNDVAGDPLHDPSVVATLELLRRQTRAALASSPTLAEEWRKREAVITAAVEWATGNKASSFHDLRLAVRALRRHP